METEAIMSKLKGAVSHHEAEIAELRAVATEAGICRESLYRALSPNGNPIL
jgi:DNA-binding phage protein